MEVVRFERNLHDVGSRYSSWKNTIYIAAARGCRGKTILGSDPYFVGNY
jgi:hypothetical protein